VSSTLRQARSLQETGVQDSEQQGRGSRDLPAVLFAIPCDERSIEKQLRNCGATLSSSHRILPEFREYDG